MTIISRHPDLEFPWPDPPAWAAPVEIMPGLLWARQPLPYQLDHVNFWVLDDGDSRAVVDTGYNAGSETQRWWEQTLDSGKPLSRVIVTHHHHDHIGMAGWLCDRFQAPLWMSRTEWLNAQLRTKRWGDGQVAERRSHYVANGVSDPASAEIERRIKTVSERLLDVPALYCRLRDGEVIDIGGREWTVIVGEGHAPEHVSLYCGALSLLIGGDQVLPTITPHIGVWPDEPEGNPLQGFLDTLPKFLELPEDTLVLPSHGLPFRGLHARVHSIILHHQQRLDQAESALTEWRTGAELMPSLFKPARDTQELALGLTETLAHLHQLHGTGRVDRDLDTAGTRRFRRAA